MKAEARVLDVTTTLTGEKVGMTIDEGALAHIMSVLTDLYSDPELAVIREYSTNAFDAHVEAGVTRPIEVTTPTPLAPFFKVRDFGAGLDADDIRDIYSRYGASTKRQSNDVVGMLGLGCKSALTYTDQFTITGIKNGICTQVSVSRDEDGSGSMTIVAEYETTDPSGVEILVPAKRHHNFEEKSTKFFSFWNEGDVLVNGKQPTRVDGLWLSDNLMLSERIEQDVVVMGNVAYPMSQDRYAYRHGRYTVVAFVNIGDVNFTPSRESLQMTAKTKATLAQIQEDVKTLRVAAAQKSIEEAASPREALEVYLRTARMGLHEKNLPLSYKGQEVPGTFAISEKVSVPDNVKGGGATKIIDQNKPFLVVEGRRYARYKGWDRRSVWAAQSWDETFWFVGYDGKDFTPTKRAKLEQWAVEKGVTLPNNNLLVSEVPAKYTDWIDPARIFNWEDVKAQKIVRSNMKRQDGRPTGAYEGYVNGTSNGTIKAEDIDTTKPVYYLDKTRQGYYSWDYNQVFKTTGKDYTFILLTSNRVAKFIRDFPNAQPAKDVIDAMVEDWKKTLTPDQITLLVIGEDYYRQEEFNTLRQFDASQFNDPAIKAAIDLANTKLDAKTKAQYQILSSRVDLDTDWTNPLNNYPLLQVARLSGKMNDKMKQDIYLYVNAVYAAGKDGN